MSAAAAPPSLPRVAFVTRKWAPAMGGMETYCLELTHELEADTDLKVIALPGRADGSAPQPMAIIAFGLRAFLTLLTRRSSLDVVHLGDMAVWPLALAAWRPAGSPVVILSAHGTDVAFPRNGNWKGRLYGAYLRLGAWLLRRARVIANSAATAEAARETGWIVSDVIPLGTRVSAPAPRIEHNGSLLFAGRLIPRKGLRWFVDHVLPRLPESVGLTVAGTVWDENEGGALSNPRVDYAGVLRGDTLTAAYASALAVIIPNIETADRSLEGFGLVAPEAAAAGGLVLASHSGGLVEAVLDGVTGFHLPAGDADAWVARITEIAAWDIARRHDFLARSAEMARSHYSWSRVAREVRGVYARMLADRDAQG